MRKALALMYALLAFGLTGSLVAEDTLAPPPEGKVAVYVGRMNSFVGGGRPFHLFEGENYLIRIKGKSYIRYVCDPGEHVFWVAAENRSFVKTDLEAGRVYAMFARPLSFGARVELTPITRQSKAWEEFHEMIQDSAAEKIDPDYIEKWTQGHPDYIKKALSEWNAAGQPSLTLRKDEFVD